MADRIGSGAFTYEVEPAWAQLPDGWIIKDTPDVLVDDAHDRVYVFTRWKHPVMVFDRAGTFITSWGSDLFTVPHGLSMGPRRAPVLRGRIRPLRAQVHHRWRSAAGVGARRTATPGTTAASRSTAPTKVAFDPATGDMYVADGYGNARRAQVLRRRRLPVLMGRAGPGAEPVQPRAQRADRPAPATSTSPAARGHRVQVFDSAGTYLSEWPQRRPPPQRFLHLRGWPRTGSWSTSARRGAGFGENRGIRGFGGLPCDLRAGRQPAWRASTTTLRSCTGRTASAWTPTANIYLTPGTVGATAPGSTPWTNR